MSDRQIFNPSDWLDKDVQTLQSSEENKTASEDLLTRIETTVHQIEEKQIDIAPDYKDWLACGFAFADVLSESGRDFFHRVSKFYPQYDPRECDMQYDNCLKSKGSGVTIASFFRLAQNAGVFIHGPQDQSQLDTTGSEFVETPVFPEDVYENLPDILNQVCKVFHTNRERDIILLGSIVTLSSCLPNLFGFYRGDKVYANLYLFIAAQASAGKGILKHCKRLVYPIHKHLRNKTEKQKAQYEIELTEYNAIKTKTEVCQKPTKPKEKLLFIPANSSSSGAMQLLSDNDGRGLIFETEGDTLAYIFKTDYGNYSDSFRNAFHHETISFFRRTNSEYIDIENPCLSTVLSGTPKQISNLIPDAENGLFSRFIYYNFPLVDNWLNVFERTTDQGLDYYFDVQAARFFELYKTLQAAVPMEFRYTPQQEDAFNTIFAKYQKETIHILGSEAVANIRRLGIIFFRISMVITVLHTIDTGEFPYTFTCSSTDFQTTLRICEVLLEHSKSVYLQMATMPKQVKQETMKDKFFQERSCRARCPNTHQTSHGR